jgi:hypothetical protein
MRNMMRVILVPIIGFTWLVASAEIASAQSIVSAVYRVSMTDPANGNVYYVDRKSIRSWSSEERCNAEVNSFSGFHTTAMTKLNITNSGGTPLEIKMDSVFCVVVRE